MKITRRQLRRIIKEEASLVSEASPQFQSHISALKDIESKPDYADNDIEVIIKAILAVMEASDQ